MLVMVSINIFLKPKVAQIFNICNALLKFKELANSSLLDEKKLLCLSPKLK